MSLAEKLPKFLVVGFFAAGLVVFAWQFFRPNNTSGAHTVNVKVPELSALAAKGKALFDANCAACHGSKASGTDKGPPLVHDIYNPGHHSDEAFVLAARLGVRQHHWPYGNMPPQPQVSEDQIAAIVRYVRELQLANGIGYRPHAM